jgi:GWxTD domain-containing protein
MRRLAARLAAASLCLSVAFLVEAQTLPELFQKAKAQVKGESWNEALKTLSLLEAESAKPGNETARTQLEAPMAFYRGVCEANIGQAEKAQADFEAFLAVQPNATMDPSMYSKKAIAAFEAARQNTAPPPDAGADRRPSIFLAFQEFKLPPNSGEQINEQWGKGPVRWIMTAQEKSTWASLAGGPEWQEFVDKFWESRNPQPGNPDNVFKTTFDRRVAFADANFVQAEGTRGSMTDRGMVFVLLGPPTYAGRKPIRTGDDSSEAAGLSSVESGSANNAVVGAMVASPTGKISSGQAAQIAESRSGTKMTDSFQNWREVWHYRKELLPKGVGYHQVDVEFITKVGYGTNVLNRDHATLATLDAARASVRKNASN